MPLQPNESKKVAELLADKDKRIKDLEQVIAVYKEKARENFAEYADTLREFEELKEGLIEQKQRIEKNIEKLDEATTDDFLNF
jgi:uncharacterized protein YllA (UPF0747 family)